MRSSLLIGGLAAALFAGSPNAGAQQKTCVLLDHSRVPCFGTIEQNQAVGTPNTYVPLGDPFPRSQNGTQTTCRRIGVNTVCDTVPR